MSHFLEKNQSSTIFCLTGIMWQKSAQGEVEQNTWLLINWLSGSLDRQPQTSKVPRTISPQAADLQNNTQTPWNLRQIGSWFWLWVLYGIVTKTWQVHSSPILVFEEKMFGSSALCRSPEQQYAQAQSQFRIKWGNVHFVDIEHSWPQGSNKLLLFATVARPQGVCRSKIIYL